MRFIGDRAYYFAGLAGVIGAPALVWSSTLERYLAWLCILFAALVIPVAIYRSFGTRDIDNAIRYSRINCIVGVFHVISASALAFLASDQTNWAAPATLTETAWFRTSASDGCDANSACFLRFFVDVLPREIPVSVLAVMFGLVSGAFHLAVPFLDDSSRASMFDNVLQGSNSFRWADYTLSSSVMIVVIAAVTGVSDVFILSGIAIVQAFLMVLSFLMEVLLIEEDVSRKSMGKTMFYGAVLVYLGQIWAPIFGQFYYRPDKTITIDTSAGIETFSTASPPAWVNVVVWGLFVLFSCFGAVMYWFLVINSDRTPNRMLRQDLTYMTLSLTAKTVLHWTLYAGISSRTDMVFNNAEDALGSSNTSNTDADMVYVYAAVFTIIGILFYIVLTVYSKAYFYVG